MTDGTSNTLAIGERKYREGYDAATWYGVGAYALGGVAANREGPSTLLAESYFPPNVLTDAVTGGTFVGTRLRFHLYSSEHPGGAQFALSDGSVRFVAETIDRGVGYDPPTRSWNIWNKLTWGTWEKLACRFDGLPTGEF